MNHYRSTCHDTSMLLLTLKVPQFRINTVVLTWHIIKLCWPFVTEAALFLQSFRWQGKNKSTSFCFLSRLSVMLASKETVNNLFLLRDCFKWLTLLHSERPKLHGVLDVLSAKGLKASCQDLPMSLFPAETLVRKQNHTNNLGRKPVLADGSLGRKQELTDSLGVSQIWQTASAGW